MVTIAPDPFARAAVAAALRVLDGAGLSVERRAIEPTCHPSGWGPADWPDEPFSCSFADRDLAEIAAADAVLVAVDPAGARLTRLLAPRPARAAFQDLRWLLGALRLAIRFEACRAEAGELVLFGDGNLDALPADSPTEYLEAAFHFARKHERRRVTLALARAERAGDALPVLETARRMAAGLAGACGLAWEEADVEDIHARASRGALRELDVVVAAGEAWERLEPLLADSAGGAPFVPSARFGEECVVLEVGCAGSRASPTPLSGRACPIAAARAAALLCEWLGESGKGARVAAATDALLREGLPAAPDASEPAPGAPAAPDDALADWTMDIADAIVRKF